MQPLTSNDLNLLCKVPPLRILQNRMVLEIMLPSMLHCPELWLDDVGKSQYGGPEGFDVFIRALIYKAKWILAKAKPSNGENGGRNE
ncbi:hypothetical protein LCGC14_1764850 [marine sediment metagenome]|uniref:Uncharacterized protein n=1 Tax=marine sediment metagenome TaxID=412755 RepID=A0A0F9GZY9_9ZZZZ